MVAGELNLISRHPDGTKTDLPPVLLVHGAWHGAWCWEGNFLDHFAEAGFPTHALDLRGHGGSQAATAMRWHRISDYVADVLSVTEAFEAPPFVIGHSMGGYICQHLIRKTRHLSGVGLLATVPSFGVYRTVAKMVVTRPIDFAKANLLWSLYPLVEDAAAAKAMFFDEDLSQERSLALAGRLTDESYLGFLDMLFLDLPRGPAPAIPMLVVGGEKDTLFSPATQTWTANRYGAGCTIVPDAPHDLMLSKHWRIAAGLFEDWMVAVAARS